MINYAHDKKVEQIRKKVLYDEPCMMPNTYRQRLEIELLIRYLADLELRLDELERRLQ